MRENFDYVTMESYSADMAELSSQAAAALQGKAKELKDLQRMIWMLVKAAGGQITIPSNVQRDFCQATAITESEYFAHDMSLVMRAK